MAKIKDYKLVTELNAHTLIANVTSWISQGYYPIGGISTSVIQTVSSTNQTSQTLFSQALVKEA